MKSLNRFSAFTGIALSLAACDENVPNGSLAFNEETKVFSLNTGEALFGKTHELSLNNLDRLSAEELNELTKNLEQNYVRDCPVVKKSQATRYLRIYPYQEVIDRANITLAIKTHVNDITKLSCDRPQIVGRPFESSINKNPVFVWNPENPDLDISEVDASGESPNITINGQTVSATPSLYKSLEAGFAQACKLENVEVAQQVDIARRKVYPFVEKDLPFPDLHLEQAPTSKCVDGNPIISSYFDSALTEAFVEKIIEKAKTDCNEGKNTAITLAAGLASAADNLEDGIIIGGASASAMLPTTDGYKNVQKANRTLADLESVSGIDTPHLNCSLLSGLTQRR